MEEKLEKNTKPDRKTKAKKVFAFIRGNKKMLIGAILLLFIAFVAIFAPMIAPYTYNEMKTSDELFAKPSAEHLFGTDNFGRDTFSRIVYGSRISLGVAIVSVGLSTVIGVPIGLFSGYVGGWFDELIMRICDVLLTIPGVLMAVAITAVLGPGLQVIIVSLVISGTPGSIRLARSMVLSIKEREYVAAAKVLGVSKGKILWKYVFPNCLGPIIVQCTLRLSGAVLSEAAISYLGYGTQPPVPSWGLMLSESQNYMWQAPIACVFPGIAILLLVLGGNLFGDGLRDLLDPRYKGRLM